MKNSNNSVKVQAQSMAVATIKAVVCVPHIILQSSADLLAIGEAKAINLIDGTPVLEAMMHRQSYTAQKMANTVQYAMDQKDKVQAKLDSYRKQDINKLKTKLDKLEGVEHITPVTAEEAFIAETVVPAPPTTEAPFIPINKRAKPTPVMTAATL